MEKSIGVAMYFCDTKCPIHIAHKYVSRNSSRHFIASNIYIFCYMISSYMYIHIIVFGSLHHSEDAAYPTSQPVSGSAFWIHLIATNTSMAN